MRKVFFKTLEGIIKEDRNIFLLFADLGVKFFQNFKNIDPERSINVGVAEANMIGVASGLAMSGKNVYCYSIIPFLINRTLDQIKVDIDYNNLNVKLLGSGGGLVYGLEGVTHHSIEDVAIMRALPNMTIVAPGDAKEAQAVAKASVNHRGPLYIRFGRDIEPLVHQKEIDFQIGKGIVINEGEDICLIASGAMLYSAKAARENLLEQGINPTLVSMPTIKPLDKKMIKDLADRHQAIFTLEDHSIIGGLGSAVAEFLIESNYKGLFRKIGIPDEYTKEIGKPEYLLEKLKLDPKSITNYILETFKTHEF